ncbi:MAG: hypothetical protein AVDCRST_MAG21-554, partial [uncultured Nocardioidaceae bacterium]
PRLPRPHRLHRGGDHRAQLPLPPGRADQSRTRGRVAPSGRREAGCLGGDPELQARRLPVLERRVHRAGVRPRRRTALLLRQPTRHHPPALLGAGLPAGAEDGVHRPAHRGFGARFQQPAPRRRRQPRTPEGEADGRRAAPLRGQRRPRRRARRQADQATARLRAQDDARPEADQPQRPRRRIRRHAGKHGRRPGRVAVQPQAPRAALPGGPGPPGDGAAQRAHQRARRHAQGRRRDHQHLRDAPGGRRREAALPAAGRIRGPVRDRRRGGHAGARPGAGDRAVLHHQAPGQGHRPRPRHGARLRPAVARSPGGRERAGPRHHHPNDLPGGRGRRGAGAEKRGRNRSVARGPARLGRNDPRRGGQRRRAGAGAGALERPWLPRVGRGQRRRGAPGLRAGRGQDRPRVHRHRHAGRRERRGARPRGGRAPAGGAGAANHGLQRGTRGRRPPRDRLGGARQTLQPDPTRRPHPRGPQRQEARRPPAAACPSSRRRAGPRGL